MTPTKTRITFPADDLAATTGYTEASIHVNSRDLMAIHYLTLMMCHTSLFFNVLLKLVVSYLQRLHNQLLQKLQRALQELLQ